MRKIANKDDGDKIEDSRSVIANALYYLMEFSTVPLVAKPR